MAALPVQSLLSPDLGRWKGTTLDSTLGSDLDEDIIKISGSLVVDGIGVCGQLFFLPHRRNISASQIDSTIVLLNCSTTVNS
jgi:hypothetical protein